MINALKWVSRFIASTLIISWIIVMLIVTLPFILICTIFAKMGYDKEALLKVRAKLYEIKFS